MTTVTIGYPSADPAIEFGVADLVQALRASDQTVARLPGSDDASEDVRISIDDGGEDAELEPEGYRIRRDGGTITVQATDSTGGMYGALSMAETVRMDGGLDAVESVIQHPAVALRAIKFNLPWDPYRDGREAAIQSETCRDLSFWADFLDMMARNRFNALTLWNLHPFTYMIRPEQYPEACPFGNAELADWREFWTSLFRMADERGIETYILNWNIVVSDAFAKAYDVDRKGDRSELVREYTRACVTQVIEEYPHLSGLGVSLCDWMPDMSPREKQAWFEDTFIEGISHADRPVNLLDRSVRTESIEAMRETIDRAAVEPNVSRIRVPVKFNWSHGLSTTSLERTHDYRSGEIDDSLWSPLPETYRIVWTVRNEDVFVLRWGDPDFVREHIQTNLLDRPAVGGYLVGSEGHIPAWDIAHDHDSHQTWTYAFERQWLYYTVWGRLLYDPETPDAVFESAFEERYKPGVGERLLEAYRLASRMPEALASLHGATWDYTLYSEGFLAPAASHGLDDGVSRFISVDELIDHETLDASYASIREYVSGSGQDAEVTPPDLADRMEANGERVLRLADELRAALTDGDGALECEIDDLEAWGHLSRYFAEKIRGGVALETYRADGSEAARERAIAYLTDARDHWDSVSTVTSRHYREVPYATAMEPGETFSWARYRDQVERDVRIARTAERD